MRHDGQWVDDELLATKCQLSKLECIKNQSGLTVHTQIFDAVAKKYHADRAKLAYYNKCNGDATGNQATLFKIADRLLHSSSAPVLHSYAHPESLAADFASFFTDKINTILTSLLIPVPAPTSESFPEPHATSSLSAITPLTVGGVLELTKKWPIKSCPLNLIPAYLFRNCLPALLPALIAIVNHSLETGCFPSFLKHAQLSPNLKNANLNS